MAEPEVSEIRILTWNLGERIPIAPQAWDADTPQVCEGMAASDLEVNIMTFVEEDKAPEPIAPEPPRKSPKEKQKKKKKSVTRESEGQSVIRLRTPCSAQPGEAVEEEGRLGSMAEILTAPTVHSLEDGAVLAAEAASV
jgi:hypothetical protein